MEQAMAAGNGGGDEGMDELMGAIGGGEGGGAMPEGMIQVTEEESQAIARLEAMGFDRQLCIQVGLEVLYVDKN